MERIETVERLDAARRASVDALIREATAVDGVPPVGEHKYLKLHNGSGPCHALLAFDDDELVGYAQVLHADRETTAELVVRPRARGRGIGSRLVQEVRRLASREGVAELRLWAYGALPASSSIATRRGLTSCRTLLQLEADLRELPPVPSADGHSFRTFDRARDFDIWLRLHNEVFADHPENGTWSPEDLDARLGQPWFLAEDFLIAERGDQMVGFNWLKRVPDAPPERPEGEIYIIGVAASERGRGLGRALAIRGLHHLRERGMRVCTLYVEGNNGPALTLYRRLGFRTRHTHRCYSVPLSPSPTPDTCPSRATPVGLTSEVAPAPCR